MYFDKQLTPSTSIFGIKETFLKTGGFHLKIFRDPSSSHFYYFLYKNSFFIDYIVNETLVRKQTKHDMIPLTFSAKLLCMTQ